MLKPEQGYTGDVIGAKVVKVSPSSENMKAVEVSLPDIGTVQSVRVTDADGKTVTQAREFEYINDTEKGRNGVIIYLDKKHNVPFRLNFNDQPEQ
jgi:exonuclease III